jgi:hypothetical protein
MDFMISEVIAENVVEAKSSEREINALSQFDLVLIGGGLGEVIFG